MLILVWKKKIRKERKNICVFLNIGQKRIRNLQRWNDTVIFFCQEVTALRDCGYHAVSTHEQGTGHHPDRANFFRKFFRLFIIQSTSFQKKYNFSKKISLQSTVFQKVFHTEYTFSENFPGIVQLFRKFSRQSTAFQKVFHYRVQFFRLFSI